MEEKVVLTKIWILLALVGALALSAVPMGPLGEGSGIPMALLSR